MSIAATLLRANHMGVKDFREHLAEYLKREDMLVVTQHGQPSKVVIDYEDMLELVDIVDELQDANTISTVAEGKRAITNQPAGIPVSKLFKKIRSSLSKRKK
jgi:prevent-host-death family protein